MNSKYYSILALAAAFWLGDVKATESTSALQAQTEADPHLKALQVARDINSVDLLSGKFYPNMPVLSIPAAPRLTFETAQKLVSVIKGTRSANSGTPGESRESYSLTFGGVTSESFSCVTLECTSKNGTGSRLRGNLSKSSNKFFYTQGQTRIRVIYTELSSYWDYGDQSGNPVNASGTWYASQIIYPDGEVVNIKYTTVVVGDVKHYRPETLTSNTGYQLQLTYHGQDITQEYLWLSVATATLVATSAPTVALARLTYNDNTVTDLAGRTYTIDGFNSSLGQPDFTSYLRQTLPGDTAASLAVDSAEQSHGSVSHNYFTTAVTRDGMRFNYSYTAATGTGYDPRKQFRQVVITGPGSYSRTVNLQVFPNPEQSQRITSDTDSHGNTTRYTYTSFNRVESVTFPEGNKEIYSYDSHGNLTKRQQVPKSGSGLATIVTEAHYNNSSSCDIYVTMACIRPIYTIDGKGLVTDYTFDPEHGGLLTKLEPADNNGVRRLTTNEYVKVGGIWRLQKTTVCGQNHCSGNNAQVTIYSYWNNTALISGITHTNLSGSKAEVTSFSYDNAGRLIGESGPLVSGGVAKSYRYDAIGRKTWEIGPGNQQGTYPASKFTYRSQDNQASVIEQGYLVNAGSEELTVETTTTNTFNSKGLAVETAVVSPIQTERLTNTSYDSLNRQSCVALRMNPANFSSAQQDGCTLGTKGIYGDDRITVHNYDANSRSTGSSSGVGTAAEGTDISLTYTANGQVSSRSDGNGNTTFYSYDGFDRLKRTTFPDNTYEENGYDANNNLTSLRKRDGVTLIHAFDNANRLQSTTFSNSEKPIIFGYDPLGRETSVSRAAQTTTMDDQTVSTTYNELGRPKTITTNGKTLSYEYDSMGRRYKLTHPDGYYLHYYYEADGSPSSVIEQGSKTLASYSYDRMSRLTGISRANGLSTTLSYTAIGNLHNFDHTGIHKSSFGHNPAGQLISRLTSTSDYQIKVAPSGTTAYLPNNLNQYTTHGGQSFSYDSNGNLTAFDGWTYSYNAHNRLTAASKSGQALSLQYDAIGRLNSSTLNGSKTVFLYDGNELIAEYNAAGTLLKRYAHGSGSDDPLVSYDGTGTANPTYLLADERGSIMAETNASGTVTAKHQYGPYGEPINQSASRFRYTGQILLPGTELYHYKARVYHPKLGRFLQTDPIGYKDGMNWYAYVGNDPMNKVDPSGLCEKDGIGTRICGGISVNSSEYGFSSFGKTLSESPVGQAFEGVEKAVKKIAEDANQNLDLVAKNSKMAAGAIKDSVWKNIKFKGGFEAAYGSGATVQLTTNLNMELGYEVAYTKGVIFNPIGSVGADIYSSGEIKGSYQSLDVCAVGCINVEWNYIDWSIGTSVGPVTGVAFSTGFKGNY